MKLTIDSSPCIAVCSLLLAAAAFGDGIWTVEDCWQDRTDAPKTALSDLGVAGFMAHAKIALLDEELSARLSQIQKRMSFSRRPENVAMQKEQIPDTMAEAAEYLNRHVCMAYPPVLCVETGEAFFFSGGRSTKPVFDFSSGIAIMKADGTIWTWKHVDGGEEKMPFESSGSLSDDASQ